MEITSLQRKRATQEHLEKRSGERNVDSGLRVQLEEDGSGRIRQLDADKWSVAYSTGSDISRVMLPYFSYQHNSP